MRRPLAVALLALAIAACGSPGGSAPSPYGGGAATEIPQATGAAKTPLPSGNTDVDNYGY